MKQLTKHPKSGAWEEAIWMPNYFSPGCTGVWFKSDGHVASPDVVDLEVLVPEYSDHNNRKWWEFWK